MCVYCRMGGSLAAPDSGFVPPLAGVPLCMCLPSIHFSWRSPKLPVLLRLSEGGGKRYSAQADRDRRNHLQAAASLWSSRFQQQQPQKQHKHRIRIRICPSLTPSASVSVSAASSSSSSSYFLSAPLSLSNARPSRPLLRIALSPKPISIRPRYWLVGSSCCHQPRAAPRHRHLRTFAPAQHSTAPEQISGCSEALAACYGRRFPKKPPALCNICPVQPFEVAEVAPVVCVADRREAEAWCLPLSYSSSCHCLHSQLSSAVFQRMLDSWASLHQLLRIGCIQSGFKA